MSTSFTQQANRPNRVPQIRLTAPTFERCQQIINSIKSQFSYQPNMDIIANGMLITGTFSTEKVAGNISQAFLSPPQESDRVIGFSLRLSDEAYQVVKSFQQALAGYFKYTPDLYMLTNALIQTGKFSSKKLAQHIVDSFTIKSSDESAGAAADFVEDSPTTELLPEAEDKQAVPAVA